MSIDLKALNLQRTALILCDLQNDFLHPEGAYGRSGVTSPEISLVPGRMVSVCDAMRNAGCPIISTHFIVVMILVKTHLSPALAVITQLLEAALIGGMVL